MLTEPAPAKINLALHVRRRRSDGYHDLETLFAFARHGDDVTVASADGWSFTVTGPFAEALNTSTTPAKAGGQHRPASNGAPAFAGADNLVTQAANAFARTFPVAKPHAITLDKRLPIASGIGGGSADAAATLRALARAHAIDPADPRLHAIAATLGADVPACLDGRTTLGTGKGDELVPVAGLAGTPLLLVNPGVALSTAAVFARWDGIDRGPLAVTADLLATARAARNDLEPPARTLASVIAEVRTLLDAAPGVLLARMSGSGATCFALFASAAKRDSAARLVAEKGWWQLATLLA